MMAPSSSGDTSATLDDDGPLPLSELEHWVAYDNNDNDEHDRPDESGDDTRTCTSHMKIVKSTSTTTYEWLQKEEMKEIEFAKELERQSYMNASNIFGDCENTGSDHEDEYVEVTTTADDNDNDGYCGEGTTRKDEKKKKKFKRVYEWCSSLVNPDGVGGFRQRDDTTTTTTTAVIGTTPTTASIDEVKRKNGNEAGVEEQQEQQQGMISVVYVLSDKNWQGFGNQVWASSRHISNMLANPITCRQVLGIENNINNDNNNNDDDNHHPLMGLTVCELGAGAGVPSWTAMHCGAARVVCTDQSVYDRVRCMAESMERNYRRIKSKTMLMMETTTTTTTTTTQQPNVTIAHQHIQHGLLDSARQCRVCPHDWGKSVDTVLRALNHDSPSSNNKKFNVIIAADCVYNCELHLDLLNSIDQLMEDSAGEERDGDNVVQRDSATTVAVALLPFALHGNIDDEKVWDIVDKARHYTNKNGERCFVVEELEPRQLTPQKITMDYKQAYVYTIRLTRPIMKQ